ncbi:hypothetical protein GCK72_012747 [Caenorhabditis remanei]|uniref:Uncharacterized protein n=1 Tax=Caenorhabditis remanei TaxID=31234 RepID=A0A6A5GNT0_CAERE|nr:hypothetical protein GCK72_012747 [Caenorhabditis remanei]KAF1756294.1 hypothetical protein GCK72_012747 [Caenorhabditis remanei]
MLNWIFSIFILAISLSITNAEELTENGRVAAWIIILGVCGGIAVSASIAGGVFMMRRRQQQNEIIVVRNVYIKVSSRENLLAYARLVPARRGSHRCSARLVLVAGAFHLRWKKNNNKRLRDMGISTR